MRTLAVAAVVAQAGSPSPGRSCGSPGPGWAARRGRSASRAAWCPSPHPETQALTQWIEFSNRLLTFLVVIVAGGVPGRRAGHPAAPHPAHAARARAAARGGRAGRHRRGHRAAAARVVVGGRPLHRLDDMVWLAVQLVAAAGDGGEPMRPLVPRAVRGLIATSTAVLAGLLVAGTFVTAAGPHAGDARTPRLDLPVARARPTARRPAVRLPRHARRARLHAATRSARPRRCGAAPAARRGRGRPRARSASPSTRWACRRRWCRCTCSGPRS